LVLISNFVQMANAERDKELERIITSGGDERIWLQENHLNKYYSNPMQFEGVLNRGSCTCNTLTPDSKERLDELLSHVTDQNFAQEVERLREELKSMIDIAGEEKFELFFSPSGSELNYYPILFSRLIHPGKEITSLITCPEELGSGSLKAASGFSFSDYNQFDEFIGKGTPIGEDIQIHVETYAARDERGKIIDHRQALIEKIDAMPESQSLIGNLVIGSKSGIEDNVTIIPRIHKPVLWVVDMCQLRVPKNLINRLLDWDVMIMVTGSKFHQAPPFCGALLVPKRILQMLEGPFDKDIVEPFTRIFSKYDIPPSLSGLRKHFRDFKNKGLLFRWEAALTEMKLIDDYEVTEVIEYIDLWNRTVIEAIHSFPETLELMPDTEATNKSIISFRIKNKAGRYLDESEMRHIYKEVVLNEQSGLGEYKKVLIGQPVSYNDRTFIRLALGSYPIRKFITEEFDPGREKRVVEIIRNTALRIFG